jgi:ATP-dependent RNA helicase RhlE
VAKDHKRALLSHLIRQGNWSQVLVFTRTKHGANRLTKQLQQDGIRAAAIHGNKSQSARTQALADFKSSKVQALVATEVASRGLDIKELPYVVNFELPNVPEDYVHRIGRTGRAGSTGIALSLVAPDESGLLKDIEKLLGRHIARLAVPSFAPAPLAPESAPQFAPAAHAPRQTNGMRGSRTGRHQRHTASVQQDRIGTAATGSSPPDAARAGSFTHNGRQSHPNAGYVPPGRSGNSRRRGQRGLPKR